MLVSGLAAPRSAGRKIALIPMESLMRSLILPWAGLARWAGLTSLFGAALIASCSSNDGITFVGAPTIIKVTGRIDISAEVATDAGPYVFTVTDTGGNGVQGVTVTFTIAGPATLLSTSAVTSALDVSSSPGRLAIIRVRGIRRGPRDTCT